MQIAGLFQGIEAAVSAVDAQERSLKGLKHKLLSDLFSEKKSFGNHLKEKDFETVKFKTIAINISERVEPKKTELKTCVGLEHLDADSLKIERTGTPDASANDDFDFKQKWAMDKDKQEKWWRNSMILILHWNS